MTESGTPRQDVQRKIPCFNQSYTETLPAFGVCSGVGYQVDDVSGEGKMLVDVPVADNDKLAYFVCEVCIPPRSAGQVQVDFPAMALYKSSDGTPSVDEQWGTKAGESLLRKGKLGFLTKPWASGTTPRIANMIIVEREVCRL